ncbi:MAG: flippase-like domain-containing protein [Limnochordaceae bacterium]|nr:flippase-like domain-containing protein [Limnochordaceae bacterium]
MSTVLQHINWRRGILISVALGAISLVVIVYLTTGRNVWQLVQQATLQSLVLGAVAIVCAWLMRAIRFRLLLRPLHRRIGLFRLLQIYLATTFVSHVTPTTTGGLPLQIYLFSREKLSIGEATALTGLDSLINTLGVLLTVPLLLWWGPSIGFAREVQLTLEVFGSLLLVGGTAAGYLLWRRPSWDPEAWLLRRAERIRTQRLADVLRRLSRFAGEEWQTFQRALQFYAGLRIGPILLITLVTILYWVAYFGVALGVLAGLQVFPSWQKVVASQIVFNVLQPIAPTPGGSGAAEWGMALLFRPFVPNEKLGTFVAIWRLFTYYASLTLGGISIAQLLARKDGGGRSAVTAAVREEAQL